MPAKKTPRATKFMILVDGKPVEWPGYESTAALGVVFDKSGYHSVMLMTGVVLARGFGSIDAAHAFNLAVAADKKLKPGTSSIQEFYASGGGLSATKTAIEKIRKRATK